MGNSNSSEYDDRETQEFHSLPKSRMRGQQSGRDQRSPYSQQQNMGYRAQNQNGGQQRGYNQQQYSGNRTRDDRGDDSCC